MKSPPSSDWPSLGKAFFLEPWIVVWDGMTWIVVWIVEFLSKQVPVKLFFSIA